MPVMLKLMAEDAADLEVIAAAAQDALVRMRDLSFDAKARRFTVQMNRFRWETADGAGPFERVRCALAFEGVLGVKSRKLRREANEALASILSLSFVPDADPPGGIVQVVLAGGGELSIAVECLDAVLIDVGPAWTTPRRPDHEKA